MQIRKFIVAMWMLAMPTIAAAEPPRELPEPGSLALFGIGVLALIMARRAKGK